MPCENEPHPGAVRRARHVPPSSANSKFSIFNYLKSKIKPPPLRSLCGLLQKSPPDGAKKFYVETLDICCPQSHKRARHAGQKARHHIAMATVLTIEVTLLTHWEKIVTKLCQN